MGFIYLFHKVSLMINQCLKLKLFFLLCVSVSIFLLISHYWLRVQLCNIFYFSSFFYINLTWVSFILLLEKKFFFRIKSWFLSFKRHWCFKRHGIRHPCLYVTRKQALLNQLQLIFFNYHSFVFFFIFFFYKTTSHYFK